jgi:hypothetical protein
MKNETFYVDLDLNKTSMIYFGEEVRYIIISIYGYLDFLNHQLQDNLVNLLSHDNSPGIDYHRRQRRDLGMFDSAVRNTFNEYRDFTAHECLVVTWLFLNASSNLLVQAVTCTDENLMFVIVKYGLLDEMQELSYMDTDNKTHTLDVSITGSNCGVPGQYVLSLNSEGTFRIIYQE